MKRLARSSVRYLYGFRDFRLDPNRRRLLRSGEIVPLSPKAIETLIVLVQNAGKKLDREALMEAVWAGAIVEDANLTVAISQLRKAFGQNSDPDEFIQTIPRVGYRFVPDVREILQESAPLIVEKNALSHPFIRQEELIPGNRAEFATAPAKMESGTPGSSNAVLPEPGAALPATRLGPVAHVRSRLFRRPNRQTLAVMSILALAVIGLLIFSRTTNRPRLPATMAEVKSMAVLPFKMLNGRQGDEYLGLGLADILITQFGKSRRFIVRPTRVVSKYTDTDDPLAAGHDLQVETILEGTIQRDEGRLRVTARLFRVADGEALWTGTFDEKWSDFFTLQDSIARNVAQALRLDHGAEQRHYTRNAGANELYLKGRYFLNQRSAESLRRSVESFNTAVEIDPNFPLAYVGLAEAYDLLVFYADLSPAEAFPKVQIAAAKALELDETLGEAHVPLARVHAYYNWNRGGALSEFRRAIELNPNDETAHHLYGEYLMRIGVFEEGIKQLTLAATLNPSSIANKQDLGTAYYAMRQYDRAIEEYKETLAMEPNFAACHIFLGNAYCAKGMYEAGIAEHERAIALAGERPIMLGLLGQAFAAADQKDRALAMLAKLEELSRHRYVAPISISLIYAGLGEKEKAIAWLAKGYDEHDPWLVQFLRNYHHFDGLRADPRFIEIMKRVGVMQTDSNDLSLGRAGASDSAGKRLNGSTL